MDILSGASLRAGGVTRADAWAAVASGLTHPRVRRWRVRVTLLARRHALASLAEYHNRLGRRVRAFKAPHLLAGSPSSAAAVRSAALVMATAADGGGDADAAADIMSGGADGVVGGLVPGAGGAGGVAGGRGTYFGSRGLRGGFGAGDAGRGGGEPPLAVPAIPAGGGHADWDAARWRRVMHFRAQETQRYQVPERSFTFINPWGNSVVSPLKRGPALDGGRPREHALLRNERPSHVTILCIVRDAASRLVHGRGTRADICDLLRDSQYLRDGATFSQLNSVVSGALDRLHYEDDAPVRYDPDTKHWCYLHNDRTEESFPTPPWAREPDRAVARNRRSAAASRARRR